MNGNVGKVLDADEVQVHTEMIVNGGNEYPLTSSVEKTDTSSSDDNLDERIDEMFNFDYLFGENSSSDTVTSNCSNDVTVDDF